jgi:hypothetical protein
MFSPYTTVFFLAFVSLAGACLLEGRLGKVLCLLAFLGVWGVSIALAFSRHDVKVALLPALCLPLWFFLREIKKMF